MQQENSPEASSVDTWWVNINPGVLGNRQLLNISEIGPVQEGGSHEVPSPSSSFKRRRDYLRPALIEPHLKSA